MTVDTAIRRLLAPEAMPARDAEGWVQHPDLDFLVVDGPDGADLPIDPEKMKAAGYEAFYIGLEHDQHEGQAAYDEYFKHGGNAARWEPRPPIGKGWRLIAIYDTDDGPYAMFVKAVIA
jgi:hypothetical protein